MGGGGARLAARLPPHGSPQPGAVAGQCSMAPLEPHWWSFLGFHHLLLTRLSVVPQPISTGHRYHVGDTGNPAATSATQRGVRCPLQDMGGQDDLPGKASPRKVRLRRHLEKDAAIKRSWMRQLRLAGYLSAFVRCLEAQRKVSK